MTRPIQDEAPAFTLPILTTQAEENKDSIFIPNIERRQSLEIGVQQHCTQQVNLKEESHDRDNKRKHQELCQSDSFDQLQSLEFLSQTEDESESTNLDTPSMTIDISEEVQEEEQEYCFICFESFSENSPKTPLPCRNHGCQQVPIHAKCIYEWRQNSRKPVAARQQTMMDSLEFPEPPQLYRTRSGRLSFYARGNSSPRTPTPRQDVVTETVSYCPLCRGELDNGFNYSPPDNIQSAGFGDIALRRKFMLTPVPIEAGFVRCFIKLNHIQMVSPETGAKQDTMAYELYLQAPTTLKYPLGPVPDSHSPCVGDQLLAIGNRTRFPKNSLSNTLKNGTAEEKEKLLQDNKIRKEELYATVSQLDLFMTDSEFNKSFIPENYLASVKTSFSGFKHEILVPIDVEEAIRKKGSPFKQTLKFNEVCCVHFIQNKRNSRTPNAPGPRKIQVCLPKVNPDNSTTQIQRGGQNQETEPSITPLQSLEKKQKFGLSYALTYKCMNIALSPDAGEFTFGRNKEPYWLDSIQAYSLDFKGRVTLPSNKNFQLMLDLDPDQKYPDHADDNVVPELMKDKLGKKGEVESDDITLQFGKVGERQNSEIFSLDFRWPLTPLQAFGICLGACDRNIVS